MGEETMTWVAVGIGLVAVLDKLGTLYLNSRREGQKQQLDTERAVEVEKMKAKIESQQVKIESQQVSITHAEERIRATEADRVELRAELKQCEEKHERATELHEQAMARIAKLESAK